MPQPTAYVPSYDFSAFQTSYPTTPLPGDKVDIEFAAVQTTLDEILYNLALIQRDDGALANGIVTQDSLADNLFSGVGQPDDWQTATYYGPNESVIESNIWYICLEGHTSGTFATDLAANKWRVLIDIGAFQTAAEAAQAAAEAARDAAEGFKDDAETAASSASGSASAAATSAGNALTSENNAATSEGNAATSEGNAATSESNASDSADLAQEWAVSTSLVAATDYSSKKYAVGDLTLAGGNAGGSAKDWAVTAEDVEVDTGLYSALHYAAKAAASAGLIDGKVISDTDGDTKFETERSADDDTLRGKAGGTDVFTMTSALISMLVEMNVQAPSNANNPTTKTYVDGLTALASASEINAGTETAKLITPATLSDSNYGTHLFEFYIPAPIVEDDAVRFKTPAEVAGHNIVEVRAQWTTATVGTGAATSIQLHNITQAADVLSTNLTIDSGAQSSDTAGTPAVINTSEDDITSGDVFRIDIDAIGSTIAGEGLLVQVFTRVP